MSSEAKITTDNDNVDEQGHDIALSKDKIIPPTTILANGDVDDAITKSEDFLSNSVPRSISNTSISKRGSGPINLMQNCVECFQVFFNTFTTCKILQNQFLAKKCVQSLLLPQETVNTSDSDSMMDGSSNCSFDIDFQSNSDINQSETRTQINLDLKEDTIQTYTCACRLLLEFSSFPIYCTDFHKMLNKTCSQGNTRQMHSYTIILISHCCLFS